MTGNADIKNYVWVDLETTGLNPKVCSILEIGAVMTGPDLFSLAELTGTIHTSPFTKATCELPVQKMHDDNGLWEEAVNDPTWEGVRDMERDFCKWMDRFGKPGEFVLCGSGVDFDRKFIDHWMPTASRYLAYWAIDVGRVRRFLRDVCGRTDMIPAEGVDGSGVGKQHRALGDIWDHLVEARHYRRLLTTAAVAA